VILIGPTETPAQNLQDCKG